MFEMNPRQMQKVMQQMGIKSEEIEAEEVVIKQTGREIIISNPQVTKIKMGGQETFQIAGEVSERKKEEFSEEDKEMIMEQTGKSKEEVEESLKETKDIAETILKLKE